jgi:predicted TIM-barrel fold metal-dependent hydrolase
MMNGELIIDAVVHPYDLSSANRNAQSWTQLEAVYAAHRLSVDADHAAYALSRDEFFSDFPYEALAQAEFVESPVDLAVIHALPNLGFCLKDVTSPDRAAAFRDRHAQRFRMFATVDTPILSQAVAQLERQVKSFKVDGLKLYPAFFYDGGGFGWRLDDDDFATPLLQAAQSFGIRHVAIHKSLWLAPAPKEAFAVDDLASPLARFPDLTFQIVHGGVAFLDDTLRLLQAHPNLHITLETMFSYILVKPRVFAKILGALLKGAGSQRLMFASGNNLSHPDPLLQAFAAYQFPQEWQEEFGLAPLTQEDRSNILGLNAARLYGLQPASVIDAVAGDVFSRARLAGVPEPWSALRRTADAPVPA